MCRMGSVVDGSDVPSGIVTGVTNLVVSAEMVVVFVEGEVWRCEEVVEAMLAKVVALVANGNLSTVMAFVVPVSAEEAVLETAVLSVATESETPGNVVEVVVGVTVDDVDISLVSLIGDLLVGVGSSVVLMVHALGDLSCVVVESESVGLVEEVNQNRAVMAKGAPLVLDVMGLTVGLTVPVVLVMVVSGASVTLTVDSGSRRSGLTTEGVVGRDGGPAVLESSGVSEGAMVGG